MIDEKRTEEMFGYTSNKWSPNSNKKVVAICEGCGMHRVIMIKAYSDLCQPCALRSRKHVLSVSDAELKEEYDAGISGPKLAERYGCTTRVIYNHLRGVGYVARPPRGNVNKRLSMTDRELKAEYERGLTTGQLSKQCGCSDETVRRRLKISGCIMRSHKSMEFKILMSTIKQSVQLRDWRGYSEDNPYCEKFDDACKVRNREKYDNQCFICGKGQSDNITTTGKQKALSVHHVDMNKHQGCDDHKWNLVPLCLHHHGPAHTRLWIARIQYLLNHVWAAQ